MVQEADIRDFWSTHPCGDHIPSGLDTRGDYENFFSEYDAQKYRLETHIPVCLAGLDVDGRRVLEVGLGQGAESELLIRRGAHWSGVDVTDTSVERVRKRLQLRSLPFVSLQRGSVLGLPFPDASFDVVFSHGVLHHVPDISSAQREIHRVLAANGELVVMVYARWSLNYLICIALLRRLALITTYPLAACGIVRPTGVLASHLRNARKIGLMRYLRMREFIHRNTDGPENLFSRVYDTRRVRRDFETFTVTRSYKRFMHAPPLPVHRLPGQAIAGWHLWVHLKPRVITAAS